MNYDTEITLAKRIATKLVEFSPGPPGWNATRIEDSIGADAAALIEFLKGTSHGEALPALVKSIYLAAEDFDQTPPPTLDETYLPTPIKFPMFLRMTAKRFYELASELEMTIAGNFIAPIVELVALTPNEQAVFDVLPFEDSPLLGRDILATLARQGITNIDPPALSKMCKLQHMKSRGVRNRPGAGYYKLSNLKQA